MLSAGCAEGRGRGQRGHVSSRQSGFLGVCEAGPVIQSIIEGGEVGRAGQMVTRAAGHKTRENVFVNAERSARPRAREVGPSSELCCQEKRAAWNTQKG